MVEAAPAVAARAVPEMVAEDALESAASFGAEESFERATPGPVLTQVSADDADQLIASGPAPSLQQARNQIPASTRGLLAELFKAEVTAVRRLSRDQLR